MLLSVRHNTNPKFQLNFNEIYRISLYTKLTCSTFSGPPCTTQKETISLDCELQPENNRKGIERNDEPYAWLTNGTSFHHGRFECPLPEPGYEQNE